MTMRSQPQPSHAESVADTTTIPAVVNQSTQVSDRFIGYVLLFVVLIFLLYILPEVLVFKQNGFVPVEHLVETAENPSLEAILAGLWADRAEILNPMNNPLVRFFLVTMIVGVVFDRVKKYSPTRERSEERLP